MTERLLDTGSHRIEPVFTDRYQAGLELASYVLPYCQDETLVVAIPFGGIPVAAPIWRELNSSPVMLEVAKVPLDLSDQRFGVGAVTRKSSLLNMDLVNSVGLATEECADLIAAARTAIGKKAVALQAYDTPSFRDIRSIVLIDDGVASGFSALSAAKDIYTANPWAHVTVASPVMHAEAAKLLSSKGCSVISLQMSDSRNFMVDDFYESFPDLSETDVNQILLDAS